MWIIVHREIPADPRLRMEWNALVDQMNRPEVFYTFEWAMAVDRSYRSSMKPLLLLAYEGEALAGVASLATDVGERQTSFLAGNTADYCDFICHPRRAQELAEAFFGELRKLEVPILRLANLPNDSATFGPLKSAATKTRIPHFFTSRVSVHADRTRLSRGTARVEARSHQTQDVSQLSQGLAEKGRGHAGSP